MAKNTRQLSIVVSVRDQTKKTLGSIQARVRQFSEATGQAIAKAFKVGLATAGVALAVFTAGIKRQFAEIDVLAKTAFRFGVAIENIRGLELAAKLSGLSLSEMTTILRDTSRRVSEAAQGTGEAQDALKELGLNAKELNMMPVEDQLDIIVKRLGEVKNNNDRVRLAFDVMGRSGTQGLTLIGTSIRGAIRETEMLGTALDDEIATNVQQANDDLERMKEAFKGIVQVAVSSLAPALSDIFTRIKRFLIEVRHGIKAIPLAVEYELIRIRKFVTDLEKDLLSTKVGKFLLGEQVSRDLSLLSREDEARMKEILRMMDDMASLSPSMPRTSELTPGEDEFGVQQAPQRPAGMPSITEGRLLTGAAQSSAERLAAIQQAADQQRRKEAADAKKQRENMINLLREAVQNPNNTQLGSLLQ